MSNEHFFATHYSETLCFNQQGKWVLHIYGAREQRKILTPKQAETYFKDRFPRWSWHSMTERAEQWIEYIKSERVQKGPKRR